MAIPNDQSKGHWLVEISGQKAKKVEERQTQSNAPIRQEKQSFTEQFLEGIKPLYQSWLHLSRYFR